MDTYFSIIAVMIVNFIWFREIIFDFENGNSKSHVNMIHLFILIIGVFTVFYDFCIFHRAPCVSCLPNKRSHREKFSARVEIISRLECLFSKQNIRP